MKKKIIIDTDAGIDDAYAIAIALKRDDVEVVAITTCHGNVDNHLVCRNVLLLLKQFNRLDIAVYKGCDMPLVSSRVRSNHYHGEDGFGDVLSTDIVDMSLLKEEHASIALVKLATKYKGELTLLCIAPLTNVATAIKLDSSIGEKFREIVVMGGNYTEGKGNATSSAEFNFYCDPEAASVCLNYLNCNVKLITWENCLATPINWDWYVALTEQDTDVARFFKKIEDKTLKIYFNYDTTERLGAYLMADQIAAAVAIDNTVVAKSENVWCDVELFSQLRRGFVVVDWKETMKSNVTLITDLNREKLMSLIFAALS